MPLHIPIQYVGHFTKFDVIDGMVKTDIPSKQCSDGHHTFGELYEHRYILWIALCRAVEETDASLHRSHVRVWRSKFHSDGTMYPDSFILGIGILPGDQITYHLHLKDWDKCEFALTLDCAPEWDGHTPEIVLDRIERILL